MRRLLPVLFVLLALPILPTPPAAAQERSLRWDEIVVNAHLDAGGVLHVRERQTFDFTGDWNGGERGFRVELNQHLELEGLYRVAEDGREVPLVEGDTDQVDHYEWSDSRTLRWRSRLPSDPPFDGTVIVYVIAYSLSGILVPQGEDWLLNHDFALPRAEWPIENLVVDLSLDPAWQSLDGLDEAPLRFTRRQVVPGENAIVRTRLRHTGDVPIAGAVPPVSRPLLRGVFAATLLIMAALYFRFRKAEAGRGRFEPLPQAVWDEAWLRENVFDLKPEEVGALWDQKIGPPEVAAVLARLVTEGKMTSEVVPGTKIFGRSLTPGVLHLHLTTDRDFLTGYERKLVDKLFFDGDDTDTDRVRARYRSTGFNPASVIEKPLREVLSAHGGLGKVPAPSRKPTLLLWLAVVVLFAVNAASFPALTAMLAGMTLFLVLWPAGMGLIAAFAWRKRTENLDAASLTFLIPGLIVLGICGAAAFLRDWAEPLAGIAPGLFACLALAVLPLAVWNSLLNNARSRENDGTLRKRRLLATARRLFEQELKSENPRLRDEWLPYLLAFGLGTNVDRWFRSFGSATGRSMSTMGSGGAGSGGSGGGGGWSGGGGQFGGAGATGTWAVAATGLASGVSAPSSSGSSGGGGGSSSGGGGGGGW